jgi:hypothetical protein
MEPEPYENMSTRLEARPAPVSPTSEASDRKIDAE